MIKLQFYFMVFGGGRQVYTRKKNNTQSVCFFVPAAADAPVS